jgi:hypothetical protein
MVGQLRTDHGVALLPTAHPPKQIAARSDIQTPGPLLMVSPLAPIPCPTSAAQLPDHGPATL